MKLHPAERICLPLLIASNDVTILNMKSLLWQVKESPVRLGDCAKRSPGFASLASNIDFAGDVGVVLGVGGGATQQNAYLMQVST